MIKKYKTLHIGNIWRVLLNKYVLKKCGLKILTIICAYQIISVIKGEADENR